MIWFYYIFSPFFFQGFFYNRLEIYSFSYINILFKKIASNTLSQVFSKAVTAIISIVLISLLTKHFSVEFYGMYGKIFHYLGIFAFLTDLGLYTIAVREISNNKKKSEKIIGNILTLRLILGIPILLIALSTAALIPGYQSSTMMIGIGIVAIFTLFGLFNSALLSLMQAHMKIEFSAISLIAGKILNLLGVVALIVFLKTPDAEESFLLQCVFGSAVAGVAVNTLLNYLYAKKLTRLRFLFDKEYIKYIFKISLPYGLALFLSVVYFKIDIILLSLLEPESLHNISIALYGVPMKIVEVLMVLGGFYLNALLPSISKAFTKEKQKTIQTLVHTSFKVLLFAGIMIAVLWTLFRDYIIEIIATREYIFPTNHMFSSSDIFSIVLFVLLLNFISNIFIYILIGAKKESRLVKINILVTLINIIGNIILIPKYSFMWAGIMTLISQWILIILWYLSTRDILKINFPFCYFFKLLIVSGGIFLFGNFLLSSYSFHLYFDFLVYWAILFIIFCAFFYFEVIRKHDRIW